MEFRTTLRILGSFLMMFSFTMVPPFVLALWFKDESVVPYITAFLVTLLTGFFLFYPFRHFRRELKTRDGFLIVSLFWIVVSVYGALPFMLASAPHETFTDAVFETVSGFTTTGSTVTIGVDYLPHAIRFYRQQLQLVGGMGIIVLALAVLPMLGVGGMQLYRLEAPGPIKDSKLTPRITETAKTLWYIYVGLVVACAICYWAAGMTFFEAVGESFATVSTGGFAMHDASFGYYNSALIEIIGTIFMFLGGVNFGLHFLVMKKWSLKQYWQDLETRAFLLILLGGSAICFAVLLIYQFYNAPFRSLSQVIFNVVSMATTTGYVSVPFATWPTFLPILIFFIAMIGGCGGSTSGGIKVLRICLLYKQGKREMHRLIHPNAVVALKFGDQTLPDHVLQAMWGFISIFIGLFIVMLLGLMACGLDITTAFGALAGCIANAGQGLGQTASNFATINVASKWILIAAMLIGRLEIFPIIILFSRSFWKT